MSWADKGGNSREMLSKCLPFSTALQAAEQRLGAPIRVFCHIHSRDRELGNLYLSGQDSQRVILHDGRMFVMHASNIREMFFGFVERVDEAVVRIHLVLLSNGIRIAETDITSNPMNPELIATATKRMLRNING